MFTYTPGGLEPIDRVRFLIQDTTEPPELQDEEIEFVYATTDEDVYTESQRIQQTVVACARVLLARYAKLVSFEADGTSVDYGQRTTFWKNIVEQFEIVTSSDDTQPWAQIVRTVRNDTLFTDYGPDYRRITI